jgi:hypothetical protein
MILICCASLAFTSVEVGLSHLDSPTVTQCAQQAGPRTARDLSYAGLLCIVASALDDFEA